MKEERDADTALAFADLSLGALMISRISAPSLGAYCTGFDSARKGSTHGAEKTAFLCGTATQMTGSALQETIARPGPRWSAQRLARETVKHWRALSASIL